ncbi:PREDICTED: zinc finger protein 616-like isoform X5 [Papilio xuthus]|uniref:Zinc finger protein 616-like isoform X5 n=1 Tax=Papilio xuthus TaxID=66420 RepID=A0AAJ6Z3K5_PAPXU|nr:PREDICTED: zinc finger protein 616-like isoform X5 [Papilio xuthus]
MDFDDIVVKESPGLCRCCLSEGCYKDLSTEYQWMDDTEIYADMLLDCFDISISQHAEGPNGANRLICEVCVTRLRDACNFKKQVLASEKKFVDMVGRGAFKPKAVTYNVPIKSEAILEIQPQETEVEFLEAGMDYPDDDVLKDDLGHTSTDDITVSTLPIKGKKGKAKKTMTKAEKKSCSKIVLVEKPKISKPLTKDKLSSAIKSERMIQYRKWKEGSVILINLIREYSTIIPFRWFYNKYWCFYCPEHFSESKKLKQHTKEEHAGFIRSKYIRNLIRKNGVKLDISEIACKKCPKTIKSFDDFLQHIVYAHDVNYDSDVTKHFTSFKLSDDDMACIVCGQSFRFFGPLLRHVHKNHNNNSYVCEYCSQTFLLKKNLANHIRKAHTDEDIFKCVECDKRFMSAHTLDKHLTTVHKTFILQCPKCPEVLRSRYLKKRHLAIVHDEKTYQIPCELCNKVYLSKSALVRHNLRVHVRERSFNCDLCDYKSFTNSILQDHRLKHFDVRAYECEFCKKTFRRKKGLLLHTRIHTNDKRCVCKECGKAFVQGSSLRLHLRVHHSIVKNNSCR